jgi:hypothetical protein
VIADLLDMGLTYDEIQNSDIEQIRVFQKAYARQKIDKELVEIERLALMATSKGQLSTIKKQIQSLKMSRKQVSE